MPETQKRNRKRKKFLKLYKSFKEMDADDKKYWASASMEERVEARKQLWLNYCLFKGINPRGQKLQRVLKIVKLPQS